MQDKPTQETNKKLRPLSNTVFYLKNRWADEKEYEDWQDYVNVVKTKVEEIGGVFKRLNKSFHVKFVLDGWELEFWTTQKGHKYYLVLPLKPREVLRIYEEVVR